MTLKLDLPSGSRLMVNGALLIVGEQRVRFVVEGSASVLRGNMVMLPAEATTPLRRLYLCVQTCYMEQWEINRARMINNAMPLLQTAHDDLGEGDMNLVNLLAKRDFYPALQLLHKAIHRNEHPEEPPPGG